MALGAAGLVMALVVLWLALRRWAPGSVRFGSRRPRLLEVTARLSLDPRKHLYIVKAAGEYVLVGTSESGVQMLKVLDAEAVRETEQSATLNAAEPPTPARNFLAAFIEANRPTAGGSG
ncbi:MAG TPA: flagellar biosynthetic protein FliO [Bryobacteraceae bacterium]|nr:flagellar biosynthetic protein FliO [Bryobacteraceae bacterium]